MKNVIVYGPGCKRCEAAREMVEAAARKLGVQVQVSKETDYARIAMCGWLRFCKGCFRRP